MDASSFFSSSSRVDPLFTPMVSSSRESAQDFSWVITAWMHNFSVTNNPLCSSSRYQRTAQRSSVEGLVWNDVQYLVWILKYWLPCSRMQSRAGSDNQTSLLEEESKSFFISPLVCVKINIQLVYIPNNCTYHPVRDTGWRNLQRQRCHQGKNV